MNAEALSVQLAGLEARYLLSIVDDFLGLLETPGDRQDPALDRLAPDPYPDDPAASAEYRRSTRDDLADRRIADATAVRTALRAAQPESDHAAGAVTLEFQRTDLDSWLRTLAAIRLVLAARLGVDHADTHSEDDARFGAYDWLGYRLELLVQLADSLDDA